jgi:predicted dehydrogenase
VEKIRFGIIGAGMIGPFHAEAIGGLDDAELIGVATTREQTVKPFAEKFGARAWYTDYHQLLQRQDIDVVNICTPPFLHEPMTVAAAEARKHVLVEKPIAVNLKQADRMIAVCEKEKVKLEVIFQCRFHKNIQRIKEAIDNHEFGRLILGDTYVKWFRSQEYYDSGAWRGTWDKEGGGALINQAIHTIDLLQWFMGEVDSLYACVDTVAHQIEVEDIAVTGLKFKNGAMGVIEGSTALYPGLPRRLDLHGERGSVILEGDDIKLWDFVGSKREKRISPENYSHKKLGDASSEPTHFSSENHKLQIKDFIEAIKKDKEPLISGIEGRKSLEIVRAIYKSGKTGKAIKFPVTD